MCNSCFAYYCYFFLASWLTIVTLDIPHYSNKKSCTLGVKKCRPGRSSIVGIATCANKLMFYYLTLKPALASILANGLKALKTHWPVYWPLHFYWFKKTHAPKQTALVEELLVLQHYNYCRFTHHKISVLMVPIFKMFDKTCLFQQSPKTQNCLHFSSFLSFHCISAVYWP